MLAKTRWRRCSNNSWKTKNENLSIASRFLTDFRFLTEHSVNELQFLAVVWAIEPFRNYVYGVKVQVVSVQKALASVVKPNWRN